MGLGDTLGLRAFTGGGGLKDRLTGGWGARKTDRGLDVVNWGYEGKSGGLVG